MGSLINKLNYCPSMPRSIRFKKKTLKVIGESYLLRHSHRQKFGKTSEYGVPKLTEYGIKAALSVGKKISRHSENAAFIKVWYSPVERSRETAEIIGRALGQDSGKRVVGRIGSREELGGRLVLDSERFNEYWERFPGVQKFIRAWLDGKIDRQTVVPAKEVVKELLQKFSTLQRLRDRTRKYGTKVPGFVTVSITHDMLIMACLEMFTGKKFESFGANVNPNAGLRFYHLSDGRTILEFRRKRFDVTSKLRKLLAEN